MDSSYASTEQSETHSWVVVITAVTVNNGRNNFNNFWNRTRLGERIINDQDLYINGDADFTDVNVGINQNDNFHFLAVSTFVVPENGDYHFQMTQKDDRAYAYFDSNKNNAIESTGEHLHGSNANRN